MSKTVVVLGAGTAGRAAAERLRAVLSPADRVVMIDRTFSGSLGLSALRVLGGWRRPEDVTATLKQTALLGVSLQTGEVTAVDTAAATVSYRAGDAEHSLAYDALLIALGAELDTAALPGLDAAISAGRAAQFYTPDGADALRRSVEQFTAGRIVVVIPPPPFKCPPAPYEAAFLLADQLGERLTGSAVRLDVITAEPYPIPVVGPDVGAGVTELLSARDIGFQPGRSITGIEPDGATVTFADGGREHADLLAVVPPHACAAAQIVPDLVNADGWIPVAPDTLATKAPGVWAVGDNTAVTLANGKPLPKAGVFAEGQALVAADQIARHLGYDAPEGVYTGDGGCLLVVGGGQAAKIAGRFLADAGPQVSLFPPTAKFHAEKEQLERDWLARWR